MVKKVNLKRKIPKGYNRIFIQKLFIENYKAFSKPTEIIFGPMINLIFGKNSSGKSSVFQSLRIFRQSYGLGNLTPFNYESPEKFRGKGGLDLDIGYNGIINGGNENKYLTMGLGISVLKQEDNKIDPSKQTGLIYEFKYKNNFYSENLKDAYIVPHKTILNSMKMYTSSGKVKLDFPNYKIVKHESKEHKKLLELQRYSDRDFMKAVSEDYEDKIKTYGSLYDPYYYKIEIDPKEINIENINEIWDIYSKTDKKLLVEYIDAYSDFLEKKYKKKRGIIIPELSLSGQRSFELRQKFIRSKHSDWRNIIRKNISETSRLQSLLKNKNDNFYVFSDLVGFGHGHLGEKKSKKILSDIKKLVTFLKSKKASTKASFLKFFYEDICEKSKELVYFNGRILYEPEKKLNRQMYFHEMDEILLYLINVIIFPLATMKHRKGLAPRPIAIFSQYSAGVFGRSRSNDILGDIEKCMDKLLVVPGLRSLPKRYFVKGLQTDYVGPQAENLAEMLADEEIRNETNYWFNKLEIPYRVDIRKTSNYYEIVWKPKNSKMIVTQTHVGLGYPVILPFIVQCIVAKNKIIVIEEPEIHLHPKLQADLGDLIVESSVKRRNQFLIETHSEDFLLRVLRKIRKGGLEPEHTSVHYVTNTAGRGAEVKEIKVNKFGQYTTPWKDNLFAERRREFK